MRRSPVTIIFLLSALTCSQVALSQQTKPLPKPRGSNKAAIKVYPARGKRIKIVSGTKQILIDLTKDISGCLDLFSYPSKRVVKQPLGIKVIDRVSKDDQHYLVLLAEAQSNCNIQGHCGAASDYTLIWLKLDANLKLEEKKAVAVQECRSGITVIDPEYVEMEAPAIKLVRGIMKIEYGNKLDDDTRTTSQLIYDRKAPELGFVIATKEKVPQQDF